jgi:hypothetical protein
MACVDEPPSMEQTGPQELDGRGKTYVQLPVLNVFGAHLLTIQSRDGMLDSDPLHAVLIRILVAALQGRFEMKYGVHTSQSTIDAVCGKLHLGLGFDLEVEAHPLGGKLNLQRVEGHADTMQFYDIHLSWDEKGTYLPLFFSRVGARV